MHNRPYRHLRFARAAFTTLSILAFAGLAYRFDRASDVGIAELLSSIGTAVLLSGALTTGFLLRLHKLRARAEAAEWENRMLKRQDELLDGDEDRAIWDAVEPASNEHDTCAFGVNVVAINQWRNIPRAG